ncbi:MAG: hypothetical protein FWJ85_09155 [Solitalea sp.]
MKEHHRLIEHCYIPLGLFLLNCWVIHFLLLVFSGPLYPVSYTVAVGLSGGALLISVAGKYKWGIPIASLFYAALLIIPILA